MQLRKESLKKFRIATIRTLTSTIPRDTGWGRGGGGGSTLTKRAAKPFEAAHEITITDKT